MDITNEQTLLSGIVGSTAYGLATPYSDIDTLAVYVAPIEDVLGLSGAEVVSRSVQMHDPDSTWHEVGKYLSLALKCNPTALELLWLPEYLTKTSEGQMLIDHREKFLSDEFVRNAFGGYAKQQVYRLRMRHAEGKDGFSSDTKARTAKHGRHTMRLLLQGIQLLSTGTMTIHVGEKKDWIMEVGELAANEPEKFEKVFEQSLHDFESIETHLPHKPDRTFVNDMLVEIRLSRMGKVW